MAFVKYTDNGEVKYASLSEYVLTEDGGIVGSNYCDAYDIPGENIIQIVIA